MTSFFAFNVTNFTPAWKIYPTAGYDFCDKFELWKKRCHMGGGPCYHPLNTFQRLSKWRAYLKYLWVIASSQGFKFNQKVLALLGAFYVSTHIPYTIRDFIRPYFCHNRHPRFNWNQHEVDLSQKYQLHLLLKSYWLFSNSPWCNHISLLMWIKSLCFMVWQGQGVFKDRVDCNLCVLSAASSLCLLGQRCYEHTRAGKSSFFSSFYETESSGLLLTPTSL